MTGPRSNSHRWTPEELLEIQLGFDQTYQSCERLALRFNVTPTAVSHMATRLGLRRTRRVRWSKEEEERLRNLISTHTIDETIRLMKRRSSCAIIVKAKKLKLSLRIRDNWYTMQEVAEILGMNHTTVLNRVKAGKLLATPHNSLKPPRKGVSGVWHISQRNLIDFIRRCPEDLIGRRLDIITFVDVLAGIKS